MRVLGFLSLGFLLAGCAHMPPLKTEAQVHMSVDTPVHAKVKATINTLPDQGPLLEVVVPPVYPGPPAACKVALIDVDGILLNLDPVGPYSMGENPVALFQEKLDAAAADPGVKAVVLRINTPGGSVAASEAMVRALQDFRRLTGKPCLACLLDEGAGGGYYLASCCDQIFAMPSSVIGGIGVILNLYYLELAMEKWDTFGTPIKSGDRIDMGTPIRKMTAQEKKQLTTLAEEYHANFKHVVRANRPQVPANASAFDGRIVSASQAQQEGLIDAVGFLPDVIERARQLAKVESVQVVMYRRPESPARSLYATVPNRPTKMNGTDNTSIPGLDRSKWPLFLYMWQADPTMIKVVSP